MDVYFQVYRNKLHASDSDKSRKFAVVEDVRETEVQMNRHW